MPAAGQGNRSVVAERRVVRRRPAPRPARTPSFTSSPFRPAFQSQQRQAARNVTRARRTLPKAPVAAPPIIPNPSHAQTREANRLITRSITRAVGSGGSGRDRLARRDALIRDVMTDPRYRRERAAIQHYTREALKLPEVRQAAARNMVDRVKPGAPPRRLEAAGLNVNLSALGNFLSAQTSLGAPTPANTFLKRSLSDVKSLVTGPFIGGYEIASGLAQDIAQGPNSRNEHLMPLAKAVASQVKQEVTHPGKAFSQHPLLTALDAAGGLSAVGRVGGAAARGLGSTVDAPGVRGALARTGSTIRPPIALVNDANAVRNGAYVRRSFSKDLSRKFGQSMEDSLRQPLRDSQGKVVTINDRGREVPVLKATEAERTFRSRQRADFIASRQVAAERAARERTGHEQRIGGRRTVLRPLGSGTRVKGRIAHDLTAMVSEGTVTTAKHFRADLENRLKGLRAQLAQHERDVASGGPSSVYSDKRDLKTARQEVATIERALSSPKIMGQAEQIVAEGTRIGREQVLADQQAVALGIGNHEQLRRSRLQVAQIAHQGGYHGTSDALVEQARRLRKIERSLQARLNFGHHAPDRPGAPSATNDLKYGRGHDLGYKPRKRGEWGRGILYPDGRVVTRPYGEATHKQMHVQFGEGGKNFDIKPNGEISPRVLAREDVPVVLAADRRLHYGSFKPMVTRKAVTREEIQQQLERARALRRKIEAGNTERMRGPGGRPLEPGQTEDFLRARGRDPNTVAFLPHRGEVVGARAFHSTFPGSRPVFDAPGVRTGARYVKGTQGTSARLLHEQGVRQATQIAKAQHIDMAIGENGLRHPAWEKALRGEKLTKTEQKVVRRGGLFTAKEAAETIKRLANDTGDEYVAVRAYPARLDPGTQAVIREELQGPGGMDSLGQRLLNNRIVTNFADNGARNIVLMDKALMDRLNAHLRPAGELRRALQWMNKPFRMAVLPQFRWLTGNFIEPYFVRLPTKGSGLVNVFGMGVDIAAKHRALEALANGTPAERAAAEWIAAQQTGSGLFIGGRAMTVRRTAGEVLPKFALKAYGKVVAKMPVVEQMADMLRFGGHIIAALPNAFFYVNRHGIENPATAAAFGHSFRADVQAVTGSWIKSVVLNRQAVADTAKGLVGTPAQQAFMHAQYELLGKYAGFSPRMRALVSTVAPFLPWALNAARFVFWTMPMHNTVKTALLVKTQQVVAKDWQQIHQDVPPGGLRLAIPNGKGGWIDLARYTPYGMSGPIAEGDNLSSITNEFTPQFAGAINALNGRDPFGRDLKVKPTPGNPQGKASTWQQFLIAANSFAEAMLPYLAMSRRLFEHGETAYSNSTILSPQTKPGTSHGMSAAFRTLFPFRPTYLRSRGGQVVSAPSSGVSSSSGIPASVQQTLQQMQTSGAGPAIPESVQETLRRLAH